MPVKRTRKPKNDSLADGILLRLHFAASPPQLLASAITAISAESSDRCLTPIPRPPYGCYSLFDNLPPSRRVSLERNRERQRQAS